MGTERNGFTLSPVEVMRERHQKPLLILHNLQQIHTGLKTGTILPRLPFPSRQRAVEKLSENIALYTSTVKCNTSQRKKAEADEAIAELSDASTLTHCLSLNGAGTPKTNYKIAS